MINKKAIMIAALITIMLVSLIVTVAIFKTEEGILAWKNNETKIEAIEGNAYSLELNLKEGQSNQVIPGEAVAYVITITNIGSTNLNNLVITADNSWTRTVTSLSHTTNNVLEYEYVYQVPTTAVEGQLIKNSVTVTCDELVGGLTDTTNITVRIPSYTIKKELAEGQERKVIPGEEVDYVITITNTGLINIDNLVVTDSLDLQFNGGAWTKRICTLPHSIGNVIELDYIYRVPLTAEEDEIIKNEATVVSCDIKEPTTDDEEVEVTIPKYKIEKFLAEDQDDEVSPGEEVDYVIRVTNEGEVDIHELVITDNKDEEGAWTKEIEELSYEEGENVIEFPFTYTVPNTARSQEVITNTATVVSKEIEEPLSASVDVTVKLIRYTIDKRLADDQDYYVLPGDEIAYTITVTNTGDVNIHNLVITDSLDDYGTWTKEVDELSYENGYNVAEFEYIYEVPEDIGYGTWIYNEAGVISDELPDYIYDYTYAEVRTPSYYIEKFLADGQSDKVSPGEEVDYIIRVTNNGNMDLNNLVITDSLDYYGTWTKEVDELPYDGWYGENVVEFTFTYQVPDDAMPGDEIYNEASVICDEISDPITDDETVTLKQADYEIEKFLQDGSHSQVMPGDEVTYVIRVTNTGDLDLNNLEITDSLDTDGTWTKEIDVLSYEEGYNVAEFTFTYQVPDTAVDGETIINTATVVCDELPAISDDEDILVKVLGYTIEKTLADGQSAEVFPGEEVEYIITLTNIGKQDLNNLVITDSLDLEGAWTKNIETLPHTTDNSLELEYVYTVPTTITESQTINNIATVVCDELPDPLSDDETVTVKVPSYEIEKRLADGQTDIVNIGEEVRYSIKVTNTGEVDIHDLVITDSMDVEGVWTKTVPELSYIEGENFVEFEYTYVVPKTVMDNDVINNVATVVSREIKTPTTDDENVTVDAPSYEITKTLKPGQNSEVNPGDEVTYIITVTNIGDVDIHELVIKDSLDESWIKELPILTHTVDNKVEYEFTYTVPETVKDGDIIDNVATVESKELGEISDNQEITVKKELAIGLQKFVSQVNTTSTLERMPTTTVENGKVIYNANNTPVKVENGDILVYTIKVYNEGKIDGYVEEIVETIPEGLEYIATNPINIENGWVLEGVTAKTNKLSSESENNKLIALNGTEVDSKEVKIALKVISNESGTLINNVAEASKYKDGERENASGEKVSDDETVQIKEYNLMLTKRITKIQIKEGAETKTQEVGPELADGIAKVDLNRKKIEQTEISIIYKIEVANYGEVSGYVEEIKDYIPLGLRFEQSKNPDWTALGNNIVKTEKTKDTLLVPGDKTEVEITLEWEKGGDNVGTKMTMAEISKATDRERAVVKDINSTPDNQVPGEDDLDQALVLIAVKTGGIVTMGKQAYTIMSLVIITVMMIGGRFAIKKLS